MPNIIQSRRNRFYKKILIGPDGIAPDDDTWKGLKVFDHEENVINNRLQFPSNLTTIVISNDSERTVEFSFNGSDLDGELLYGDGPLSMDCTSEGYIWFRLPEGISLKPNELVPVRVFAWRGGSGK